MLEFFPVFFAEFFYKISAGYSCIRNSYRCTGPLTDHIKVFKPWKSFTQATHHDFHLTFWRALCWHQSMEVMGESFHSNRCCNIKGLDLLAYSRESFLEYFKDFMIYILFFLAVFFHINT